MKRTVMIISVLIIVSGVTAFGYNTLKIKDNTINVHQTNALNCESVSGLNSPVFAFPANLDLPAKFEIRYGVWRRHMQSITKGKIEKAMVIREIFPNYPDNWIFDYEAVEILTTRNGVEIMASGPNENLTREQKDLIKNSDLGEEIIITVRYKTSNPVTHETEHQQLRSILTLIPEVEAEFVGGYEQMITYLEKNSLDEIEKMDINQFDNASVIFTVNEKGQTENIKLSRTFGDERVDNLLVELIKEMPNWNPAKNEHGLAVKQVFELYLGEPGC